jgi:hypothetical protein
LCANGDAAIWNAVRFFKRILNFDKATAAKQEQRHAQRYPVEPTSPVRATLQLGAQSLPGRLVNLSSTGASIACAAGCTGRRGDPGQLKLNLDRHELTVAVSLAHAQVEPRATKFGLEFKFTDFDTKHALLQLLEPIAIGAGLAPGNPSLVRESEPGLLTKQFHGPNDTLLTVWRKFAGQAVHGFEFRMHDYFVRSGPTPPALEIFIREEPAADNKPGYRGPALQRSGEEDAEIRQLFRWVLPHLNPQVPDDVREFLRRFAGPEN